MTSEIAVMNRTAVALAADSAVTLSEPTDQGPRRKTYYTTNKLFTLSKYQPIGIMIYGNAQILRHPWETVIKIYREDLGSRSFTTTKEAALDFLGYLDGFFPTEEQTRHFRSSITGYFSLIRDHIDRKVRTTTEKAGHVTEQQVNDFVGQIVEQHFESCRRASILPNADPPWQEALLDEHSELIDEVIAQVFDELPLSEQTRDHLCQVAIFLCSRDLFPAQVSGIVVAGFGRDQIFPSAIVVTIDGVVNGRAKYRIDDIQTITPDQQATVMAFAQQRMVNTFIGGVDPRYKNEVETYLRTVLSGLPDLLTDCIDWDDETRRQQTIDRLAQESDKMIQQFKAGLAQYQHDNFVSPVLSAVGVLPKEELAEMAESLVNLTSLKLRVSMDEETVGGPIDVAVISKGDGFVWIERKHYFDAALNYPFFANYFQRSRGSDARPIGSPSDSPWLPAWYSQRSS